MNADEWRKVEELYHAALDRPPEARAQFLSQVCADDTVVLREVESLLGHEGQADGLLESPAWVPSSMSGASLEIGQTISHYRVTAKVGEGGMGVVWQAFDSELKRSVAIKSLPAAEAANGAQRLRFLHEARSASALNHPNILTIHDILHEDGATYLVTEFIEGKSLAELILKSGMPLKDALPYAIQIADALTAAHKIGIVHRDLKPANIMVTPAGRVKLVDFGLAKQLAPMTLSGQESTPGTKPLTATGVMVGTLSYMSPEQAECKEVDARSDIFSFGAVLYEMVTGRRAFGGDSAISILTAVLKEEPRPISGRLMSWKRSLRVVCGKTPSAAPSTWAMSNSP